MQHTALVAALFWTIASAATGNESERFHYVDLQKKANVKLTDDFHADNPGNNLAQLKPGEQELAGVKFKVDEKCIQLGNALLKENGRDFPSSVAGIELNAAFSKLHVVHAIGYGIAYEQQPDLLPKDKVIAKLVAIYDDDTKEVIPIVFGEDVCDWWYIPGSQYHHRTPKRAKIAWEGSNEVIRGVAEQAGVKAVVRLYLTTWNNPKPDRKVRSLEFATADAQLPSAPFCVAITAEID